MDGNMVQLAVFLGLTALVAWRLTVGVWPAWAALVVGLAAFMTLDSKQFSKGLTTAQSKLGAFGKTLIGIAPGAR